MWFKRKVRVRKVLDTSQNPTIKTRKGFFGIEKEKEKGGLAGLGWAELETGY